MRCLLYVGVHAKDGSAGLERVIQIPFCPVVGMSITGVVNPDGNLFNVIVDSVTFDSETGELSVHLENDDISDDTNETLDEKLSDWGDGWLKTGEYRKRSECVG